MPTNEQSLLEDTAHRILADEGLTGVATGWSGSRVLVVGVDPADWARAARGLSRLQSRAADSGFKVQMRAAPAGSDPRLP